jgi:ATP phosphoribosyltransferase
MSSIPSDHCLFAVPKKGRLYEKVTDMLRGAGVEYHREPRLDIAICKDLPMTMVFLPASDIPKYVGEGNVDIGVTGIDIVEENGLEVERVMDLGFGKCRLCVQAPVAKGITDVKELAGSRIVTSFPELTKKFFDPLDKERGVKTSVKFVSGSVEAACGLGLADAVVDLVETGTTMKVRFECFVSYYWCGGATKMECAMFNCFISFQVGIDSPCNVHISSLFQAAGLGVVETILNTEVSVLLNLPLSIVLNNTMVSRHKI